MALAQVATASAEIPDTDSITSMVNHPRADLARYRRSASGLPGAASEGTVIPLPTAPARLKLAEAPSSTPVGGDRHQRVRVLLAEMIDCQDPLQRQRLQSQVVLEHQGVARSIAARYRGRGVEREDLEQLANLGLVKAVLRWQPGRSEDFLQFAVPTIAGEIKRYFRDHTFMVRPPRRIQELRAALNASAGDGGGDASVHRSDAELGTELGVDAASVREARQAGDLCRPRSLDAPSGSGQSLSDSWGADDEQIAHVEDRLAVEKMLDELNERERAVVRMRFEEGLSQARIGEVIGVSQMQVSRLLRGIVGKLRDLLVAS